MKPKVNRKEGPSDNCQTPPYAIDPLLPYLNKDDVIWEPAAGEGMLAQALHDKGLPVIYSSLHTGQDFFSYNPTEHGVLWNTQVTNPPYSIKFKWLRRSYELGKPFALLVPVEMIGAAKAQVLMEQYGFEIMLLRERVDFKMPDKGWTGAGAQFPVMWFCWNLLPEKIMYGSFAEAKRKFKQECAEREAEEARERREFVRTVVEGLGELT
jgi:hypothetical protein